MSKLWGAHPSRVWSPASPPGTRSALALTGLQLLLPKLYAMLATWFSRLLSGGDAGQ